MTSAETTALEQALQAMSERPDDTTARLAFHAELSRTEVFVLLESEVDDGVMVPQVFDLPEARAVLAFDGEMRLAGFAGTAVAYAALPGRVLVAMLADSGEGLSLLLNPDSPHAALLAPEALDWLTQTLAAPAPSSAQAVPLGFFAPDLSAGVLALLVPALERRLSGTPGLTGVVLAGVAWQDGGRGHVLALAGLPEVAEAATARAVAEALALSGIEAGALDVIFPAAAPMARIAAQGLALSPAPHTPDADQIVTQGQSAGANPGLDPTRPPRLR